MTRTIQGSEPTNRKLAELETRLRNLKRSFDMYFNGVDKLPPLSDFDALKRDVRGLTDANYSTAVLRFKVQNFVSRFNQFRSLWERQLQQLEDGSFKSGRRVALVPRGRKDINDIDM
jgi:hypothetical protein